MITFILVVAAFAGGVAFARKWQKVVDFDVFKWLKSHIG